MNFIRSHIGTVHHCKIQKLAKKLKIEPTHCVGILTVFWQSVWEQRPSGELVGWDIDDMAISAMWAGDSQLFFDAMCEVKLIDIVDGVAVCHEWMKNSGRGAYEKTIEGGAARQRKHREKSSISSQNDSVSRVTNASQTVRDQIRIDKNKESDQIRARDEIEPEHGWMDDSLALSQDPDQESEQVGEEQRPINLIIKEGTLRGITEGLAKLEAREPISYAEALESIAAMKRASRPPSSYGFCATTIDKYRNASRCSEGRFNKATHAKHPIQPKPLPAEAVAALIVADIETPDWDGNAAKIRAIRERLEQQMSL